MEKEVLHHPAQTAKRTLGQKAADVVTKIVGSWVFILTLLVFLLAWMALNAYFLINYASGKSWDPYPFILLNLVLSCLATIEAPIILMSQNRQAHRERLQAEYDYTINKKAEKEIQDIQKQLDRIEKKLNGRK